MLSTIQLFVAYVITYEFLASTLNLALFLLTEAFDIYLFTTLLALPLVTLRFTLMLHTVEQPPTGVLTAELAARGHRTWHSLGLFGTETLHRHGDIAGGARSRVA